MRCSRALCCSQAGGSPRPSSVDPRPTPRPGPSSPSPRPRRAACSRSCWSTATTGPFRGLSCTWCPPAERASSSAPTSTGAHTGRSRQALWSCRRTTWATRVRSRPPKRSSTPRSSSRSCSVPSGCSPAPSATSSTSRSGTLGYTRSPKTRPRWRPWESYTDANGRFRLSGLAHHALTVEVTRPGHESSERTVLPQDASEQSFVLPRQGELVVQVKDAHGKAVRRGGGLADRSRSVAGRKRDHGRDRGFRVRGAGRRLLSRTRA